LTVENKIAFAEYFLDKINKAQNREDFLPNLSAFLSEAHSIPEYLLEDANMKFKLGIPLTDRILYVFEGKAVGNPKAEKFSLSFDGEYEKLKEDPIGKLLTGKRNVSIHRKGQEVKGDFTRELIETIDIHDTVSVEVRDKYGNLKMRSDSKDTDKNHEQKEQPETNGKQPIVKNTDSVKWFFKNYTVKDVVGVCEDYLAIVKIFVNNLKSELP